MKAATTLACSLALAVGAALPASATVLYDNGATDPTLNSRSINYGNSVADSFTLATDATVSGISFQSLDFPGTVITGVYWAITPTVDFGAATALASITSNYLFTQGNGYHVDSNSFSTGTVELAAGTYYLLLSQATTSTGSSAYWAESGGPSQAYQDGFPYEVSESFQVNGAAAGSAGAVPEPASWLMFIGGFGLVGAAMRRRTRYSFA